MTETKFFTMPILREKTAGWPASKIGDAKNRFLSRATRVEASDAPTADTLRGLRSLVQALAEIEGDQLRRDVVLAKNLESRAA
jgi:hypothetical protein